MVRVNCGLDFLEHYQLGIKLGVMPVLGNLVNVDAYVADGVANSRGHPGAGPRGHAPPRPAHHLDLRPVRQLGQVGVHPGRHERPGRRPARGHLRPHRPQRPDLQGGPAAVRDDHLAHLPLPPQAAHPAGHARTQGHGGHAPGREGPAAAPQPQEPDGLLAALPRRRRQAPRLRRHGPVGRLPAAHGRPAPGPRAAARGPAPRPGRRDRQLRRAPPRRRRRAARPRSRSPTSSPRP
ncbi:MAG: hypothetical protein MZU79_07610 [Anaerotruncus sp.]|nr:hypothetical protein [Anaerotruncus sp.]